MIAQGAHASLKVILDTCAIFETGNSCGNYINYYLYVSDNLVNRLISHIGMQISVEK
jgi:hypothetical protein